MYSSRVTIFRSGRSASKAITSRTASPIVWASASTPLTASSSSGDYKFDNTPIDGKKTDYAKVADFSRRGVLLLMGDSTNSEKAGWTHSEIEVNDAFDDIFRQAKDRII